MADLDTSAKDDKKKGGKVRSKKSSTKIDMTPMVDLGFLLLTFFMLATSFNKPQVMEINMPKKPKKNTEQPMVNEKKVLNLVLGDSDKIYYYMGLKNPDIKTTNYSKTGVRKILLEKKATISGLVVLVKPMKTSKYKNIVSIFDEMSIDDIPTYAMVDLSSYELDQIKKSNL